MPNKQLRIALAVAVASLGSLAGAVSTASAHTWDHRTSHLNVPPPSNFVQCAPGRRIHLTGGQYRWHAFIHHTGHRAINRDTWTTGPRLDRGWYRWNDCIKPFRANGRYIYTLTATLRNEGTGVELHNDGLFYKGRYGSGTYHWGSVLDRVECRLGHKCPL